MINAIVAKWRIKIVSLRRDQAKMAAYGGFWLLANHDGTFDE